MLSTLLKAYQFFKLLSLVTQILLQLTPFQLSKFRIRIKNLNILVYHICFADNKVVF